ncbi:TPA: hypothetical protein ACGQK4_002247 [Elizabethkingia anophelis]|nr:hypothetical protein [Elizabethkingia anophelis]MCT4263349.1 hypothetical protein [Elizabethkingia anophelis]
MRKEFVNKTKKNVKFGFKYCSGLFFDYFCRSNNNEKNKKMITLTSSGRIDDILSLIKKNGFSLTIDNNPSNEKLDRIKKAIARKQQLFERTIEHYKKEPNELGKS